MNSELVCSKCLVWHVECNYPTPDCIECGIPMEHFRGSSFNCIHWKCDECKTKNWPADLDTSDDCPVCKDPWWL